MRGIDTVVIGAGQAGLAVSWHLTERGIDHVVLDRGGVANAWTTERWDSLRLITPNWMSRLPGWSYGGPDPDGYMTADEVARYLQGYRMSFGAPVQEGVEVCSVGLRSGGFHVRTSDGAWRADSVVVATGATGRPHIPAAARGLSPRVTQLALRDYRRPDVLPDGGVLVVGASASGLAIADELAAAGRDVVLSVGRHAWLPRELAGRDIWWWMSRTGWLSRTVDEVADPDEVRREPRLQLLGRRDAEFDLGAAARRGITLVGRVTGATGATVGIADDLPATVELARRRSAGLLHDIARAAGLREVPPPPPVPLAPSARELRLDRRGIRTVIWATGHREHHPWLRVPAVDASGRLVQYRGRTFVPGLYVVGSKFQHRRDATFLDGVRHDARDVVEHLASRRHSRSSSPSLVAA